MDKEKLYELGKRGFKKELGYIPDIEECKYYTTKNKLVYKEESSDWKNDITKQRRTITIIYDDCGRIKIEIHDEFIKHIHYYDEWFLGSEDKL